MANYRKEGERKWGKVCFACGIDLGIEYDHTRGKAISTEVRPLCGTCHNLKTSNNILWDEGTKKYVPNPGVGVYTLAPLSPEVPYQIPVQIIGFLQTMKDIWEAGDPRGLLVYYDAVAERFFTECHLSAAQVRRFVDFDTALDPDLLPQLGGKPLRLNRDIVGENAVFKEMQRDAGRGRPFSDIVCEWNTSYNGDKPLKILGGQHRAASIVDVPDRQEDRLHGFKVYFGLNIAERGSLSVVFNRNIPITKPFLDRMAEHRLTGAYGVMWSRQIGLLGEDQDFPSRIGRDNWFTAQLLRCLIINFYKGTGFKGNIDEDLHRSVYIPKSGVGEDPEYRDLLAAHHPELWADSGLLEMGRQFAILCSKQVEACSNASDRFKELRKVQHRYKALTPPIAAAWAYTAGVLQRQQKRLKVHYELPALYDAKSSPDPLNSVAMSQAKPHGEKQTYRGLGTRQTSKEAQRLVQLFLLQSSEQFRGAITRQLIDVAVQRQAMKMMEIERLEKERKAQKVASRFRVQPDRV